MTTESFTTGLQLGMVSGVNLNLVFPVTLSDGKTYYLVDVNNDGTADEISHVTLDELFNNGNDRTDTQPSGAVAGVDDARTLIVNGYTLVNPTTAEFVALRTELNHVLPKGWVDSNYATSTQAWWGNVHHNVSFVTDTIYTNLYDGYYNGMFVVQVLGGGNNIPTGGVTITGTAKQGQILTATNNITDADGMGTISYQWLADGQVINGATGASLTLTQDLAGHAITAAASYTDGRGTLESMTSNALQVSQDGDTIIKVDRINWADWISFNGSAQAQVKAANGTVEATLTNSSGIAGIQLNNAVFDNLPHTWDWQPGGVDYWAPEIGLFESLNKPTNTDIVQFSQAGKRTLTFNQNIGDVFLAVYSANGNVYRFNQDFELITTTNNGIFGSGQIDKRTVVFDGVTKYEMYAVSGDAGGILKFKNVGTTLSWDSLVSEDWQGITFGTNTNTTVNHSPTGAVTITGTAKLGQTLGVTNSLADADGMGTISYQWLADGQVINGAMGASLTLTQDLVGHAITAAASYTDGGGTLESVTSSPTNSVALGTHLPTGSVFTTVTVKLTQNQWDAIAGNKFSIEENAAEGRVVGKLTVAETTVDSFSYAIVAGNTDVDGDGVTPFAIDKSTGMITVNDAGDLNYEIRKFFDLGVNFSNGSTSSTIFLAINVKDVNGISASQLTNSSTQVRQVESGHVYEIIEKPTGMTWAEADAIAQSKSLNGVRGHLVTITSAEENDIVLNLIGRQQNKDLHIALGGTDEASEGNWYWVGGPEDGIAIRYSNWGLWQPDNAIGWNYDQNYLAYLPAAFNQPGKWDDCWNDPASVGQAPYTALIVEYSADKWVNSAPQGTITIIGSPRKNQKLTIANTLSDADGLGTISYQWMADGQMIDGATRSSFTITRSQMGKAVKVVASYIDGNGALESVTSSPVQVANYNTSVAENTTTVTSIEASDALLGTAPKYTLSGLDAKLFKISSKGVLTFATAKDYEQPVDLNQDGTYEVSVWVMNAKTGYGVVKVLTVGVEFTPILGTASADTLKGTAGYDTLDGLGGDDKLTGGAGLDTFLVTSGHDTILDFNLLTKGATGSEILQVSAGAIADATLKAAWTATSDSFNDGTANLTTKGMAVDLSGITNGHGWNVTNAGAATTITGSQFNDVLTGGTGNDILLGGAGNDLLAGGKGTDILTGGTGNDTFRLGGDTKTDHITDFISGTDRIELDNALFKALLTEGQLAANQFAQGTVATTATQRIVYDQPTGNLWYDADGSGKGKAVLIGVLDNHQTLTYADLAVI